MESFHYEWIEIASFLEPMDVLASLMGISRTVQQFARGWTATRSRGHGMDGIDRVDLKSSFGNLRVYYDGENDDDDSEKGNNKKGIKILKNKLLLIRYYLIGFAEKMANKKISTVYDYGFRCDLELFKFYRKQLSNCSYRIGTTVSDEPMKKYIKYTIIGNRMVGKSRFFRSFSSGQYSPYLLSNIGADFCLEKLDFLDWTLSHQLWHGSLVNYANVPSIMTKNFHRSSSYTLLCFSIDNRESFEGICKTWIPYLRQLKEIHGHKTCPILIGFHPREKNFTRRVSQTEATHLARKHLNNSIYIEVDSSTMRNVYLPSWFIHLESMFSNSWKLIEERQEKTKTELDCMQPIDTRTGSNSSLWCLLQ